MAIKKTGSKTAAYNLVFCPWTGHGLNDHMAYCVARFT